MRLCSSPGCARAIPNDARYCDACNAANTRTNTDGIKQHTSGYTVELDKLRTGSRWQRVREIAINRCPICARCQIRISEIVDHLVPAGIAVQQAQDSGAYPYDRWAGYYLLSNLQGLCRPCHYRKTDEDKQHVGPWPDVVAKEQAAPRRRWAF